MAIIQANNVFKSYGELAVLKGISLSIEAKEIVSIVGASGAGKTTLLQILGTLDRPDQGQDAATDAAERIVVIGWSRRGVHHGPDPRAGVRDRHVDQADQGCLEDGPGAGA